MSAAFVAIYLAEAHAADEWPLGSHVQVVQHQSLRERADTARRFVEATRWDLAAIPVYLDGLENKFMHGFAAHPERFFVFDRAEGVQAASSTRLLFSAPGRHGGYRLDDLEDFLRTHFPGQSR